MNAASPPRVNGIREAGDIAAPVDPILVLVYSYWNDKRAGRRMPSRADIDPVELRDLVHNGMLLDVVEPDSLFHIRLVGQAIVDFVGVNNTGKMMAGTLSRDPAKRMVEILTSVVTHRAPRSRAGYAHWHRDKSYRKFEASFLPLFPDDQTVDKVLSGTTFDTHFCVVSFVALPRGGRVRGQALHPGLSSLSVKEIEMPFTPFNFQRWLAGNAPLLKPPVSNRLVFENTGMVVQVIGGPNQRVDFHDDPVEEFFYQLKGDMVLKIAEDRCILDVPIREGEVLLIPPHTRHSPQRPVPGSLGLVVEGTRRAGDIDGFEWYCFAGGALVHRVELALTNIVSDLPPLFAAFQADRDARTCRECGALHPGKEPPPDWVRL